MSEEDYLRASGVGAIRARDTLQSLINRSKADSNFRNAPANLKSVLQDMPADRAAFVQRQLDKTGGKRLNEAAKAMLAPYADGRSEFQRELGRGLKDPFFAEAYAERFPITNAVMKLTPAAVGAVMGIPLGLGTLYDESRKLGTAAIGGLKDIAEKKGIRFPNLFSNQNQELSRAENEQNMLDNTLATLNRQSEISATPEDVDIFASPQTDIAMAPDLSAVSAPAFERIFALPGDNLGKFTRTSLTDPTKASVTRGNYLVSDPGGFLRMATLPTGMAQGGIASLQDPNYNLLMEASDFSL